MTISDLARGLLDRLGLYVKWQRNLPPGHDWLADLQRFVPKCRLQLLFDVGANRGQTATAMHRALPRAKIHAFEPVPSTFAALRAACGHLPGVHLHEFGFSDQARTVRMRVVPGEERNSVVADLFANDPAAREETLQITTVDDFCRTQGIQAVDVLKTDTEGGDVAVLNGAARLLEQRRIGAVFTEVTFDADNALNTPFAPVNEKLMGHGFRLCGIYDAISLFRRGANGFYCNALFVRGDLL